MAQTSEQVQELRQALDELLTQQLESLRKRTFVGATKKEYQEHEERLEKIREVSADLLAAMKRCL